jgi:hypothetical protein
MRTVVHKKKLHTTMECDNIEPIEPFAMKVTNEYIADKFLNTICANLTILLDYKH